MDLAFLFIFNLSPVLKDELSTEADLISLIQVGREI